MEVLAKMIRVLIYVILQFVLCSLKELSRPFFQGASVQRLAAARSPETDVFSSRLLGLQRKRTLQWSEAALNLMCCVDIKS